MKTRLFPRLPLLIVLVLLLACASLPPPLDRVLGGPAPVIQCTPPPRAADETYACGLPNGDCPGGCGLISVKMTPDAAAAGGNVICPIVVRTPLPSQQVDPHVAVCATATEVAVGDVVIITARAVDIGLPYFTVSLRPEGAADFVPLVEMTFDKQVTVLFTEPIGEAFVYTQARGSGGDMTIEFLAAAPGRLELWVRATGEIHYGDPGPATPGGGGSEVLVLTAVVTDVPGLPVIQCTPPLCAVDETYACGLPSAACPGGCGTICVKKTPDPAGPQTDTPAAAGPGTPQPASGTPVPAGTASLPILIPPSDPPAANRSAIVIPALIVIGVSAAAVAVLLVMRRKEKK